MSIEIPVQYYPGRTPTQTRKAIWCMNCDEVFPTPEQFVVHGCPVVPARKETL